MIERIIFGIDAVWSIGAIILFTFYPRKVIVDYTDTTKISEHTKDCIRMLGPCYLGLTTLSAWAFIDVSEKTRLIASSIFCVTFMANVLLEAQWMLSQRWKSTVGYYLAADILVTLANGFLVWHCLSKEKK